MRNKIIATLLAALAAVGATGVAAANPEGTVTKPNGVTVIAGDSLAAAGTPTSAIAYAAAQSR